VLQAVKSILDFNTAMGDDNYSAEGNSSTYLQPTSSMPAIKAKAGKPTCHRCLFEGGVLPVSYTAGFCGSCHALTDFSRTFCPLQVLESLANLPPSTHPKVNDFHSGIFAHSTSCFESATVAYSNSFYQRYDLMHLGASFDCIPMALGPVLLPFAL
jgi:hypothetical protein